MILSQGAKRTNERSYKPSPEEVRLVRETLGMSAAEFARFVGVTRRTVQYWQSPTSSRWHAYPNPARWELALMKAGKQINYKAAVAAGRAS